MREHANARRRKFKRSDYARYSMRFTLCLLGLVLSAAKMRQFGNLSNPSTQIAPQMILPVDEALSRCLSRVPDEGTTQLKPGK